MLALDLGFDEGATMTYDPAALRKMSSALENLANITFALYVIAGIVTALASIVTVASTSASGGTIALTLITGFVYGAILVGVGYLIAFGMRVGAQLLLAVVQIESNTAGSTDASVTDSDPAYLRALYEAAEQRYADFAGSDSDDAFWGESKAAESRRDLLASLEELAEACAHRPDELRQAVARKCRAGFPLMADDAEFEQTMVSMEDPANGFPI